MKTRTESPKSSDTLEAIKHRFVTSPLHNFLPLEVEGFDALVELALDLGRPGTTPRPAYGDN